MKNANKNYRMMAPPSSGFVRSSRDHGRMMGYLHDAMFVHIIFTHFDTIFMHLMHR